MTNAGWKNGLARPIIGGLSSSMVLSLIVVPVVYFQFTKFLERLGFAEKRVVEVDTEYVEIAGEE